MIEGKIMSDEQKEKTEEQKNKESEKQEEKKEESKSEEKKEDAKAQNEDKAQKEEKKEEPKEEKKPEPSGKFKDLIKKIEELSVLELAELVKELEDRFGVSAAAPVAVAAAGAPAGGGEEAEEKASYTIHLKDTGAQKIAVIKAIREIRPELGLKEAKDLVDAAPKDIKTDVPKKDAEEAKKKLETAGAKVELK